MNTIFEIIDSVAAIGSTKAKQEIIEKNKDNTVLMNCFFYSENPRFNYFMKLNEAVAGEYHPAGSRDLDATTFSALDKIISREYTGDAAKRFIATILIPLSVEARRIVIRIINKDLRCGAGTSISNKVWKDLIPEYPVLLCGKMDEKAMKHLVQFENTVGFWVELKEDGGRLLVTVEDDGTVVYKSRAGNILNMYGVFDKQLSKYRGIVFDGELVIVNADGKPDRKKGNGFYTKAVRGTITETEAKQFTYKLWDAISLNEYQAGYGTQPYTGRRKFIGDCKFKGNMGQVDGKFVKTLAECMEFYAEMREADQEGAIIKVANAVWEDARSKNYVKLKAINDIDARCIGWEKGAGKNANKIGNLICETACGLVQFNVGTGLSDEDRERDPADFVGKIIECTYNEVITAKGRTTKSLFLPVYKQIRLDKNRANILEELK